MIIRLRHILFAALASILAAAPLHAAPAPDVPPITGVVVDSAGAPLSSARVALSGTDRGVTTAADGTFALRAPAAGQYHIDVSRPGFAPAHVAVTVPENGTVVSVRVVLRSSPLALQGIVVTATPGASDPLRVARSATQLSGKELDRSLGGTVAQTLSREPGIEARFNGPAASTPVIRGLSGDRVLVLENGQRTGDLSGAAPDHGLSIDPLAATRIEVVRGPASLLYGSSALGGVVNVIEADIPTSIPGHVDGFLATQGETATPGGALTAEATMALSGSVAVTARGGFRRASDLRTGGSGTLENTYLHNEHGDVGAGYVGDRLSGGLAYSIYRFDYGLPFPDAADDTAHIAGRRHALKGRSTWSVGAGPLRSLNLDGTAQWYAHDELSPRDEVGTAFKLNTQTLNLVGKTAWGEITGAAGFSALLREYSATGEEALTPAADSRSSGVFIYQDIPVGPRADRNGGVHAQVGARYDLFRIVSSDGGDKFGRGRTRDFSAFTGSAGVTIPLGARASLGASAARAFRAPTVEELFSNAFHAATQSFERGNANLDAETNNGLEAVLRTQLPRLNGQVAAYYNRINNYIAPDISGDITLDEGGETRTVPLADYRQNDATLKGLEGRLESVVAPHIVLGVMGDVTRGEFTDGRPLPFLPAARVGGEARYDDGRFSFGGNVRHAFGQDHVSAGEVATDANTLLDVSAGYGITLGGRINQLTLRLDNAFDTEYRDATSRIKAFAPNPGRNLSLVYKVLF